MLRRGAFLLCVCMLLRGAAELFSDATPASGIEFQHANSPTANKYLIETMSGGVALLDYDGDNLLDIFFTNGARLQDPMPRGAKPDKTAAAYWNRLYRNQGNGRFEDVTDSAGVRGPASSYSMGAAVGDYDNDGDADLYVTAYGGNTMYRNNGDGTFTDVTDDSGTGGSGWSTSAGFFDYNHDGKLDLFVGRYLEWSFEKNIFCGDRREGGHRAYCHPNNFQGVPNLLYRNDGGGKFTEVAVRAGVADGAGKALGVAFADYDNDGWQDIYVANDSVPCFLYRNKRDGTFEDVSLSSGAGLTDDGKTFAGMGVDFSDYDNDGLADIFVTDLSNEMYVLYRNTGDGFFSYETQRSGVGKATMLYSGWGTRFFDFDNDGWKDIFAAQGHVLDTIALTASHLRYLQRPLLLRNAKGRFTDTTGSAGKAFLSEWAGRGVAIGDLDNDGDLDVVTSNCGQRPYILRNESGTANNWLSLRLKGTTSNRDGIGSRVTVHHASGMRQVYEVNTSGSYLSASDKRLVLGAGRDKQISKLEIQWPSGRKQIIDNVGLNKVLDLIEPN